MPSLEGIFGASQDRVILRAVSNNSITAAVLGVSEMTLFSAFSNLNF